MLDGTNPDAARLDSLFRTFLLTRAAWVRVAVAALGLVPL